MRRLFGSTRGFTAAEATIVLSTVSILAAAAAPSLGNYVSEARITRARDEVRVVAMAVTRLSTDILSRGEAPRGLLTLHVAVSPGDVPSVGSGVDPAFAQAEGTDTTGLLNEHLMTNDIGYPLPGPTLPPGLRGWTGPYLDHPLGSDPWGRRYTVRFGRGKAATIVLSAGPDGVVSTTDGPNGLLVGGDDIVSVISGR